VFHCPPAKFSRLAGQAPGKSAALQNQIANFQKAVRGRDVTLMKRHLGQREILMDSERDQVFAPRPLSPPRSTVELVGANALYQISPFTFFFVQKPPAIS